MKIAFENVKKGNFYVYDGKKYKELAIVLFEDEKRFCYYLLKAHSGLYGEVEARTIQFDSFYGVGDLFFDDFEEALKCFNRRK